MYNHMQLGASVRSRIPFGRWHPVGKLNGKFKMRLSNVTVLYALSGTTVPDKMKYGFFFGQKIMSVSSDMSKNIRVGRSEKSLFYFHFFIEVMAKLSN